MRRAARLGLLLGSLVWIASSAAIGDPPLPSRAPADAPGAKSVGTPEAGFLFDASKMPESGDWVLADPDNAWGTEETIDALMRSIRLVRQQFADTPPAVVGSISRQFGGPFPPHQSHRTGRDADVHFFLLDRNRHGWYEPASDANLDRVRSWALLKAVLLGSPVDFVLIDREVQRLLADEALASGEPEDWVRALF